MMVNLAELEIKFGYYKEIDNCHDLKTALEDY